VYTGEVLTGTEERLATGDAVNVAARLEQAAEPGEVLIGEATYALVRHAVVAEPLEPLTLRGKSEPVPALRLVSVLVAPERSHTSRFVGRDAELQSLAAAWEQVQSEEVDLAAALPGIDALRGELGIENVRQKLGCRRRTRVCLYASSTVARPSRWPRFHSSSQLWP